MKTWSTGSYLSSRGSLLMLLSVNPRDAYINQKMSTVHICILRTDIRHDILHIKPHYLTNHQSRTGLTAPVFLCFDPLRGLGAGRGSRVAAQGQRWVIMILRLTCRHTSRSVQMGGGAYAHLANPFTYIEIYVLNEPLKANSLQPIRRSRLVNVLGAYTHRLLLYPCN